MICLPCHPILTMRLQECRYQILHRCGRDERLGPFYNFDADKLYDRRFKPYCDNCLPKKMAQLRDRNGNGAVGTCRCEDLAHAARWVCVPCLQRMDENFKKTAQWLCTSRLRVAGCLGATSRVKDVQGVCRWCSGTGQVRKVS